MLRIELAARRWQRIVAVVFRDEEWWMNRTVQVSLFTLASVGGVLAGALMADSSDRAFVDAQHFVEQENQQDLLVLTEEVARLSMMAERGSRSAGDDAEEPDFEEPDFEELIAMEREIADRRAATITAAAELEPVDSSWAPAVERQIAAGLADEGPPGATLTSVACKTTLCIAEIEYPRGDDGTAHVRWLSVFDLPRGFFVHHEPEPGRRARTTAYLARDGHSLPHAEPSAVARTR